MPATTVFGSPQPAMNPLTRQAIVDLVDAHRGSDGRPALSDQLRLDLVNAAPGTVSVISGDVGAPRGYGQASPVHGGYLLGVVGQDRAALLQTLVDRLGDAELTWWEFDPDETSDRLASSVGLHRGRELLQMRVDLPLPGSPTTDIATRDGRPDDAAAWVEVNNAAFAWHPEQAGWTVDDFAQRQAEPWFRLDGLRILEIDGRMAGFCWTKIHADHRPPLGEIYVIAVHPDFHRRGLGRALTIDGLRWLAGEGLRTGMLYVDADNTAAVEMYRRLGFHVHERQQAYTNHVATPAENP